MGIIRGEILGTDHDEVSNESNMETAIYRKRHSRI